MHHRISIIGFEQCVFVWWPPIVRVGHASRLMIGGLPLVFDVDRFLARFSSVSQHNL
jgi:hypothetical protein